MLPGYCSLSPMQEEKPISVGSVISCSAPLKGHHAGRARDFHIAAWEVSYHAPVFRRERQKLYSPPRPASLINRAFLRCPTSSITWHHLVKDLKIYVQREPGGAGASILGAVSRNILAPPHTTHTNN